MLISSAKQGVSQITVYKQSGKTIVNANEKVQLSGSGVYLIVVSYSDGSCDIVSWVENATVNSGKNSKGCFGFVTIPVVSCVFGVAAIVVLINRRKRSAINEK